MAAPASRGRASGIGVLGLWERHRSIGLGQSGPSGAAPRGAHRSAAKPRCLHGEGGELLGSARGPSSSGSPRSPPCRFAPDWTAGNVCFSHGSSDLRFGAGGCGAHANAVRGNPRDNPESDAVGFAPFSDEGAGSVAEVTQLVRWGALSWKPDWLGGGGTWEKKSLEPRPASPAPPRAGRRPGGAHVGVVP